MDYIIISNAFWAIALILLYGKYSHLKKSSLSDARRLRRKADQEIEERKNIEAKLLEDLKGDDKRLDNLLREASNLKKDLEMEMKLRLEMEKILAVTNQKNEDLEKMLQEYSGAKNSAVDELKEVVNLGNQANKNLISSTVKGISEYVEKAITKSILEAQQKMIAEKKSSLNAVMLEMEDPAKMLVPDLIYLIRSSGYVLNVDYFSASDFVDEDHAKAFLCEIAFLRNEKLYLLDFKAGYYFAEYSQMKASDHIAAENSLKQKLDKYIAYLASDKYRESVLKAIPSVKFKEIIVVFIVPFKADLQILDKMQYREKARKSNIEVMEFESVNNLIL